MLMLLSIPDNSITMKVKYSIDYINFYINTDINLIKRRYKKAI